MRRQPGHGRPQPSRILTADRTPDSPTQTRVIDVGVRSLPVVIPACPAAQRGAQLAVDRAARARGYTRDELFEVLDALGLAARVWPAGTPEPDNPAILAAARSGRRPMSEYRPKTPPTWPNVVETLGIYAITVAAILGVLALVLR